MEPVTSTIDAMTLDRTLETTTATIEEISEGALETGALGGLKITSEVREAIVGENGLVQQIDWIKSESMDALAARNEAGLVARLSEFQIGKNQRDGAEREDMVRGELGRMYPAEDGYHIEEKCYLRDKERNIVGDPKIDNQHPTEGCRIIDFVIIKDDKVVKSVEVTSETADKTAQLRKEARIRDAGGNFVVDRKTGELAPFASGVKTETVRRA